MNILLVNHYAGSPYHGMEFRPFYLAKEWQKSGHKVLIVGAGFSHLRLKQPEIFNCRSFDKIDGINYLWFKASVYAGNGLGRIKNMFEFLFALYRNSRIISRKFCPDAVIASSTYPLDIFPCSKIARLASSRLIYEIHDLWPLSPMEIGGYSRTHPFILTMQAAEDYAYRNVDKVVSILPNTLSHCVQHGLQAHKWCCVTNGFPEDGDFFEQLNPVALNRINSIRQAGKILIGYAGGHNASNALDLLLESMVGIDQNRVHLFLVGKGAEKEKLETFSRQNSLPVEFLEPISRHQVGSFLKEMDVLYAGGKTKPLYRFGIAPNKVIDYLLSARPIIQPINSPGDLVEKAGAGFKLLNGTPEEVRSIIQRVVSMPKGELTKMGLAGREYALKNLSYKKLAQDFISNIT